ncbi:PqqD family protein [Neorhodopirellula lusitana]|uniref:PqqD family protein n=1 Tax=Neorhodopirellula lusitana TaxID=445327 RepID=UPI00384C08ED
MTEATCYRLNEPQVLGELLDGEYVIIHFDTGCYYSVRDTAADVCRLLFAGVDKASVIELLDRQYSAEQVDIAQAVLTFINGLVEQQLIVEVDAGSNADHADSLDPAKLSAKFVVPVFEQYDDMADQLLLDPIHEIDERGWPQRTDA